MRLYIGLPMVFLILGLQAQAETADVNIKGVATDQDTSIVIKKSSSTAQAKKQKVYEVIAGTEEIVGDPGTQQEALQSWKKACAEWKAETKELNNGKDSKVLTLSCGSHTSSRSENFQYTFRSTASYKIRVPVKEDLIEEKVEH